jgi:membrane-associated protein
VATPRSVRFRTPLLWFAAVRAVLAVVAIPLAPFLYEEHFVALVLLRPTKEVLLAGGFFLRRGDVALLPMVLAAIPLMVFGVWLFYFLGRGFRDEIESCDLPGIGGRLLPAERINRLHDGLERAGGKLIFLGRLAAFPSTLVAASAGSSEMRTRKFLRADGLGAIAAMAEVIGAGFVLGEAYKSAGPWLTVAGVAVLAAGVVLLGRSLKKVGSGGSVTSKERTPRELATASPP